MHTPESIEAMDANEILLISDLSKELHETTVGGLDMLNPDDVWNEIALRRSARLKLAEASNVLSAKIADLEALKRELAIRKGYLTGDIERLESHRIGLFVKQKELRESHG